ncbi:6618_t:CDS:2 [Entrophospora sp. SA101]|nr:6618_t:CDS:2 [Entrophospora sp. SA101]
MNCSSSLAIPTLLEVYQCYSWGFGSTASRLDDPTIKSKTTVDLGCLFKAQIFKTIVILIAKGKSGSFQL